MKTTPVLCVLGIAMLAAGFSTVRAQAPDSVLVGVYTDAQAMRGAKVFSDNCAPCHGDALKGTDTGGPPLTGMDFINGWKDMTVGALMDKISMDMPSNAPGSLMPAQYADTLAFILQFNKYPAGQAELGTDAAALKTIKMAAAPTP